MVLDVIFPPFLLKKQNPVPLSKPFHVQIGFVVSQAVALYFSTRASYHPAGRRSSLSENSAVAHGCPVLVHISQLAQTRSQESAFNRNVRSLVS